jgi:ligand-binding sensor domain-containing protein
MTNVESLRQTVRMTHIIYSMIAQQQSYRKFVSLFFVLYFTFCTQPTFAQRLPYTFEQVKVDGGSLDNLIYCMLKDSRGYLWLGTANGLKRYDPTFTISYNKEKNNKNSLVHNNIGILCEDQQGRIWIGTTEGVCYFDRKTNLFTRIEEVSKPDFACRNIICDSRGDIWFSIRDGGLYKLDTKTNKLTNFKHENNNPKSISFNRILVNGLKEDPSKKGLWIACQDKLNYFDFASQSFYHSDHNPLKIPILTPTTKSALTIEQNLLVYSDNATSEICWYDTRLHKIVKTFKVIDGNGKSHTNFYKIFFDSNKDLWIGTYENIMFYVNAKLTQTILIQDEYEKGNRNSFAVNAYNDVLQEENGTIWFGTLKGLSTITGLAVKYPNDQLFNIYDFSKKMFGKQPDDGTVGFIEDSQDNTWWFLTGKKRIFNYNPVTDKYSEFKVPDNPEMKELDYSFSFNEYKNKLLVFKYKRIYSFDKLTHRFEEIKLSKELKIEAPFRLESGMVLGDSLWVFRSSQKSLNIYNYHFIKKRWSAYPVIYGKNTVKLNETKNIFVAKSLVTKKGEFWLAIHSGGLAKFNPKLNVFEVIKTKQDIDFTKVGYTGFDEDKEGNIWIATYDLVKFNPKTYDFQSVLDRDMIGSMVIDSSNNICMATLEEFMFFKEKTDKKYSFTFRSNTFFDSWGNNLNKLKNAKLLSRNNQSVILLNFKDLKLPSSNDKLYIARVQAGDSIIQINENNLTINFRAEQNSVSIAYGVLMPPETNIYVYYYQLEGFDKDWKIDKSQSRYAIYGNLAGGDYIFKIKAKDTNGNYLPTKKLYLHIDIPFYKTLWFRIVGFLLAIGLVLAFIRYRANQRKKIHHLQIQSTRLEKDKTEIQYQNLINHLNPHFLFNSLTSLNGLILSEPDIASDFLQKLSKIYRYILQNKDTEIVSLDQELGFVKNYIDLQKSRFDEGLQVNIDIDEDYLSSGIVPVTLQNLFENAIKHNTVEEDKPLFISVFIEDEHLIIKNNLQKKKFVETSNKQGIDSLKSLYKYLIDKPLETIETESAFVVRVPLL